MPFRHRRFMTDVARASSVIPVVHRRFMTDVARATSVIPVVHFMRSFGTTTVVCRSRIKCRRFMTDAARATSVMVRGQQWVLAGHHETVEGL